MRLSPRRRAVRRSVAYRIAALQASNDQQSALKLIIIAAPRADFETFAPLADGLLETVQFAE